MSLGRTVAMGSLLSRVEGSVSGKGSTRDQLWKSRKAEVSQNVKWQRIKGTQGIRFCGLYIESLKWSLCWVGRMGLVVDFDYIRTPRSARFFDSYIRT